MSTTEMVKKDGIGNYLEKLTPSIERALPTHATLQQYVRAVETSIRKNPKLQQALQDDPRAFGACIVEAAQLGLPIGMRNQASLVPFKNRKSGKLECTLICGYEGLLDLAYRSDRIESIFAEVVCKKDEFDYRMGDSPHLFHKPRLDGSRGAPFAAYAVAKFKGADAGTVFVVLSKDEIEKVRKASPGSRSSDSPWNTWPDEMWKKTAIKRLCKIIPKSTELRQALQFEHNYESNASVRDVDATVLNDNAKAISDTLSKNQRTQRKQDQAIDEMADESEAEAQEMQDKSQQVDAETLEDDLPFENEPKKPDPKPKAKAKSSQKPPESSNQKSYKALYEAYVDDDGHAVLIDDLLKQKDLKPLPQITPQDIDEDTAYLLDEVLAEFKEETE